MLAAVQKNSDKQGGTDGGGLGAVTVAAAEKKSAEIYSIIAHQAEEACHLEGNKNDPDFGEFEQKYCLCCFA